MKKKSSTFHNFSKEELLKLLADSKTGSSESFQKLSATIREISYSYFNSKYNLKRINYKEDVEDLTQNVYLTFAEQYQNINNIENWLRRVLFLTFVNWYSKSQKNKAFELDESYYINESSYDSHENLDVEKIISTMNTLTERKQSILKLRFWGGLKFSEIAEKLGKKEAAIKKMFYRTIEEIKEKLE